VPTRKFRVTTILVPLHFRLLTSEPLVL
jgi:hypothetical protein